MYAYVPRIQTAVSAASTDVSFECRKITAYTNEAILMEQAAQPTNPVKEFAHFVSAVFTAARSMAIPVLVSVDTIVDSMPMRVPDFGVTMLPKVSPDDNSAF